MKALALECSTQRWSLALCDGERLLQHEGEGGAQVSAALIPALQGLLAQAQLRLEALDVIVVGRGPGAFTGVRTACAVAQGLAFGARLKVLPVDSLLALAEQARFEHGCPQVLAVLDARMDQVYHAAYRYAQGRWQTEQAPALAQPEAVHAPPGVWALAGNAVAVYGPRLSPCAGGVHAAWPSAAALLRLTPALLAQGQAVAPERLTPLYVRDKVALTSAERVQG